MEKKTVVISIDQAVELAVVGAFIHTSEKKDIERGEVVDVFTNNYDAQAEAVAYFEPELRDGKYIYTLVDPNRLTTVHA